MTHHLHILKSFLILLKFWGIDVRTEQKQILITVKNVYKMPKGGIIVKTHFTGRLSYDLIHLHFLLNFSLIYMLYKVFLPLSKIHFNIFFYLLHTLVKILHLFHSFK